MLFISVYMNYTAKQSQLMHNITVCFFLYIFIYIYLFIFYSYIYKFIYLFIFYSSSPRHVSASNYAIMKWAVSKLHKMCMNLTIK
jgi:hypothetical protein